MEVREAKIVTFSILEAAKALAELARERGLEIPAVVEHVRIDVDSNKNVVQCTFVFPVTMKIMGNA